MPGWREVRAAPLEEICARQYVACNEAALDARADIDPARWFDVSYEDLVRAPLDEVERLYSGLGLLTDSAGTRAATFAASATALTAPSAGKWREQNPEAIARIAPLVAGVERRLGYDA